MLKLTATNDPTWLDELVAAVEVDARTRLRLALEQLGQETIDYLKALAEPQEFRPALRRSKRTGNLYQVTASRTRTQGKVGPNGALEGERLAHPGHWADRSTQLVNSYSHEVVDDANGVTLILRNTAAYAFWVEAMDGFFVLSGVLDPGGPAEVAFRAIATRLFPDWKISTDGTKRLNVDPASA